MAKKVSRNSKRIAFLSKDIEDNILQNEDFERHVKEVVKETGLPEDAVKTVLGDFFLNVPKIIYSSPHLNKRISFFGFFTLEIKKKFNINNLKNRNNGTKQ